MDCPQCQFRNPPTAVRCQKCATPLALESATTTEGAAQGWSFYTPSTGTGAITATLPVLQPDSLLGNRYEILQLLGEGGMGAVYKARDRELDRLVALKVIRPELAGRPEILQRFKQELILARQVTHKNVIRIFDLGEADGIKFITMEYIEGQDLRTLLRQKSKFAPEEAVGVIQQVCRALDAAHSEGVVHRDLKPQNIMVDKQGRVSVMDFGIARSMETPGMTQTGAMVGTPEYMSPEQVKGEPADARSDLFSAGLIFYELLTGKSAFQADTALATLLKRTRERATPPIQLDPAIPQLLSDVATKCLEMDPTRRYQSSQELLRDLEVWQGTPPGTAAAPALFRLRPVLLYWKWIAAALAAVVLLVLAFAIPSLRTLVLRRPPATTTTRPAIPALAEGKYVAVLPFRVLGDPASLSYVAEGIGEALYAKLFQLKDVRMASAAAVDKASKKESLEQTARDLGVNLVVQGMVQGTGERLRIIVNLEDVAGGRRLWSQEFSGVPQDLLTLEDQIYAQLVAALEVKPSNEEMARAARPTENIEAYDLYLKGRNALRGQQDIKNVEAAIRFFEEALKKDPAFAVAYAGLADASLVMYREKKDSFWSEKALGASQQAQRLNDSLAEVHFSLGSVYNTTGKTAEAIAELRRALELAPNSDEGYRRLGAAYLASARKEEAIQAYQKAIDVNPYYWFNHNSVGMAHFRFGENEKALSAFRRVTELEPGNVFGYRNIGAVYFRQGKYEECIPAFLKAIELQPHPASYSNLGTAYFYLKRYDEAVQMFEKAVEMNPNEELRVGNLADAYRWSGQKEKAMATYEKAIALAYKELQVNPRKASTMGSLALYYAKKGDTTQATGFIRRARSIDPADVGLIYIEAVVQSLANRPNEALKTLRAAFLKGYPTREAKNDPELNTLHARPEFEKLVKEFSAKSN